MKYKIKFCVKLRHSDTETFNKLTQDYDTQVLSQAFLDG